MVYDKVVMLFMWVVKIMGLVIDKIGFMGLEYVCFFIDFYFICNYLYVKWNYLEKLVDYVFFFVKKIVE